MADGKDRAEESDRWKHSSELRRQVYFAVEDIHRAGPVARAFGVTLFVLIVLNAGLALVDSPTDATTGLEGMFFVFAVVSSVLFGIEYAARLWIADLSYPALSPVQARFRYALSPMGVIDLLAFLPGLLMLVMPVSSLALDADRLVRLFRLIKLSRYMRGVHSIIRVFRKRRSEIVASFMVMGLLTVIASMLMFRVEHPAQPDKFTDAFTGLYWAVTTVTATGYGDLVPITVPGRLIGMITMILSIGIVAIPAGIFSAGFVAEFRKQDRRVGSAADTDADGEGDGGDDPDATDGERDS